MTKLLFFNRTNDRSEIALCKGLFARGYQLSIIGEPEDNSLQQFEDLGIPVKRIKFSSRLDFKSISRLKRYLKFNNFDIIYCPPARCLTALMLCKLPSYTRVISYRGTLSKISKFNPIDKLCQFADRLDAIVCNSQAVANKLFEYGISGRKLHLIYKGHDINWYNIKPTSEFDKLNLASNKFILGYVANIRSNKGGNLLLESLYKLKELNIPIHLVHLGHIFDKEFEVRIKELQLSEEVSLLGFKDNAISWYQHFDLTVMPSTEGESFSRSIVEAMSQKVPVLSSNVGGMAELIDNRQNGLIFQKNNLDELVRQIKFAYKNPKYMIKMSNVAFSDIQMKYNVELYLDNYESIFQNKCGSIKAI